MKTTIEIANDHATYEFTHGSATRRVTFRSEPQTTESETEPDFESLSEVEYQNWLRWLNAETSSQPLDENGIEIPA